MDAPSWAMYTCRYARLPDKRLRKRLVSSLQHLVIQPQASLAEALGHPRDVAALYDFWNNDRITATQLLALGQRDTTERVRPLARVLAIQDTTELNFTTHASTKGLGPVGCAQCQGLFVHSVLAATVDGVPLGLLAQHTWVRDPATTGKRATCRTRVQAEKESQKWLTALAATEAAVPSTVQVITLGDREADVYELFAAPRPPHSALLIRLVRNRRVTGGEAPEAPYLWQAVLSTPERGRFTIEVGRKGNRPPRQACLALRYTTLAIWPPRHHPQPTPAGKIPLQIVAVREVDPPAGEEPIEWLLGTTLPVSTLADAREVVRWYSRRWLIERFHFVLKSGCRFEDLQLRTLSALQRALATYDLVACRILHVTYQARVTPTAPCTHALSHEEWQVLHVVTQTTPLPAAPPPLATAVRQLAQLGGHRGYPSAGPAGVKVLWHGFQRLHAMVECYRHLCRHIPGFHLGLLSQEVGALPLRTGT